MNIFRKVREKINQYQGYLKNMSAFLLFILGILLALTGIGAIAGLPVAVGLLAGIATTFGLPLLPVAIAALVVGAAIALMPQRATNLVFTALDLGFDAIAKTLGFICFFPHRLLSMITKRVPGPEKYLDKYIKETYKTTNENDTSYGKCITEVKTPVFNHDPSTYPAHPEQINPGYFAKYFYGLFFHADQVKADQVKLAPQAFDNANNKF